MSDSIASMLDSSVPHWPVPVLKYFGSVQLMLQALRRVIYVILAGVFWQEVFL